MGYTTTHNYIVKSSSFPGIPADLKPGQQFTIEKAGYRHYMMNCPLYLADSDWKIIGKCVVDSQTTSNGFTTVVCTLLFLFTSEESEIVTKLNRTGEKELEKMSQRVSSECPFTMKAAEELNNSGLVPDADDELIPTAYALSHLKPNGLTIAYTSDGEIQMQGFYVGIPHAGHVHSFHNKIWINESDILETNIRHSPFQTAGGCSGIVFNKFDLID